MLNNRTTKWTTIDTCFALGILAIPFVVVHAYNKIMYESDNEKG